MAKGTGGEGRRRPRKSTPSKPRRVVKPDELLDFIELPVFTKRWNKLGLNDEDDLAALQWLIMTDPQSAKPIEGTMGIRKLRFAPPGWNVGKRGATRVLYVYFEALGIVLLTLIYGKEEVDNISVAVRKYLNKLVDDVDRELRRRSSP